MSDPHVLAPGTAPTPFTADEIRAGCPDGRTITLLVEPAEGPSWQRVNRFVAPDEDGATVQRWRIGTDGRRDGEIEEGRTTWLQLQGHASFPVSAVTVTPDTVELPLGTVDALRYAVDDGGGGGTDRTTMVSNELP